MKKTRTDPPRVVCPTCGKEFPRVRFDEQKYCGAPCKRAAAIALRQERRDAAAALAKTNPRATRPCEECGAPFVPTHNAQRYCSRPCADVNRNMNKGSKDPAWHRLCARCRMPVFESAAEAASAGSVLEARGWNRVHHIPGQQGDYCRVCIDAARRLAEVPAGMAQRYQEKAAAIADEIAKIEREEALRTAAKRKFKSRKGVQATA